MTVNMFATTINGNILMATVSVKESNTILSFKQTFPGNSNHGIPGTIPSASFTIDLDASHVGQTLILTMHAIFQHQQDAAQRQLEVFTSPGYVAPVCLLRGVQLPRVWEVGVVAA